MTGIFNYMQEQGLRPPMPRRRPEFLALSGREALELLAIGRNEAPEGRGLRSDDRHRAAKTHCRPGAERTVTGIFNYMQE